MTRLKDVTIIATNAKGHSPLSFVSKSYRAMDFERIISKIEKRRKSRRFNRKQNELLDIVERSYPKGTIVTPFGGEFKGDYCEIIGGYNPTGGMNPDMTVYVKRLSDGKITGIWLKRGIRMVTQSYVKI